MTTTALQAAQAVPLLKQPLVEFFERLTTPADLQKTLHRLLFENLREGKNLTRNELDNFNALLDFMLACQLAFGATLSAAQA